MARKMKDSGIEWIGEIPEGWEVHRIKNHFLIISGSGFKPELQGQSTGDFPVCKASDISSSGHYLYTSANYITTNFVKSQHFSIIPKGSILFAKIGEAMRKNNRSLCLCDCCVDNNCQGLVPKKISSEFSYYLFTCIDMTWFDNAGTIPCINNQKLYDCRFPFPSHDEQLLIANALNLQCTKINEILSHIRSSIEEYKKLKQAVITQAVTKGVRGEREMKDSGVEWIGEIPWEWDVTKIGRIGQTSSGATPLRSKETSFFDDATIRWVRTLDLNDGLVYDSSEKITELALSMSACSIMPTGTVCVAMYGGAGTIGKCGLLMTPCATNQAVCSIICNSNVILPKFLLNQLLALKPYWMKYAVGTRKDPNISQDIVARMKVLIPPLSEQKEIVDYLDAKCAEIDGLIAKKEQLVKELENYKKSLIYEVVTGKREV